MLGEQEILKLLDNSADSFKDADYNLNLPTERTFFIQTSGSSGERKNIAKSLKQMLLEAQFLRTELQIQSSHCFFSSASHQHLYGLTFKVFLPLVSGSEIICENLNYPEVIFEILNSRNPKNLIFLSSPILLESLMLHPSFKNFNVTLILTAGSKLNPKTHKYFLQTLNQTKMIEIYGSTETGVIAFNEGCGLKLFSQVHALVNEDMRLVVQSPWQEGEEAEGFLTNDCVEINGKNLKILGRFDRVIKLHDRRIGLEGIESLLESSELVNKSFILQENPKRLSAIIVLSALGETHFRNFGKRGVVKRLQEILNKEFPNQVRYFYFREKLPYDAQGKISKQEGLSCIQKRHEPEFTLLEKTENFLRAQAYIGIDCFYFNGHFLDFPLVPGFVELGFVYHLLNAHLKIPFEAIKEIESIKFMHFLRPKDTLTVEITQKECKFYFKMFAGEKECANGRLRFLKESC